ncbi:NAD(P)(+) transhydrogenase (Re/Si-specific) subunit beta [Sphingomonas paucimobilis]|uniref:NAD(P)(+) transhydrogenase (Re/Si-specific) subunit beta n=1 Tax=Sphingomonas paucimobilis TaxID=13689 RepID=UPI0028D5E397|nr:NAD(P)(+) transhydrogenase (Re/Si-specific) subunit beta [Sphingomonas paucimobilis]
MATVVPLLVGLCGFVAALLFILGLKRMSSPASALSGIMMAGIGMIAAIASSVIMLADLPGPARAAWPLNGGLALLALVLGGGWAWWRGRRVAMTAMPQMVALYNGMGGGAAAAVAAVALTGATRPIGVNLAATLAGALIGAVSLSGSVIAWAKLDGRMGSAWRFPAQRLLNGIVILATLALGVLVATCPTPEPWLIGGFFAMALLFGIAMTLPIGGADMPVVISLYNAFTGLAVGLEGYALGNPALMIAGMVVGSAGTLLTLLMAKAMNRSLTNVLFSDFGETGASTTGAGAAKPAKTAEASDAALTMRYSGSVVIVPGYGLAVAQAQQKLYELVKLLQAAGVDVKFAIHPVAGRMPGHMNVLLAEAGVPYDLIFDMDEINDDFGAVDVALVIGANDVVNPAARTDKASPIYGMPILNVDRAHQVYVIKRGQGKGYAGVDNLLFGLDNCAMVYGDAQAVLAAMVQALKDSG